MSDANGLESPNIKERARGCEQVLCGSEGLLFARSCEHINGSSGTMKGGTILDSPSDC